MDDTDIGITILIVYVLLLLLPAILGIFIFKQIPIVVKHGVSGMTKTARWGWSWTYLYFGWFVPLLRGELVVALLHFIFTVLSARLWQIIGSFFYNKQHLTRLLTNGWTIVADQENYSLISSKLGLVSSNTP